MNNKSFWDTCIALAFVFHINSLHSISHMVFDSYPEHYWSEYVKDEYERRYDQKFKNLSRFFQDLNIDLEFPNKEFYSSKDLIQFAMENYSGKLKDDAKSSIKAFWEEYIGIQSQIPFYNLKSNIVDCLIDLAHEKEVNNSILKQELQLTPPRTDDYDDIDSMLKSDGVKPEDCHVVLDGHDFAFKSNEPIDFITFDEKLYFSSKNIKILSFDSIKGKYDFKAS